MKAASITHGDDLDGLTCGALLMRLFDAEVTPANYDDLEQALSGVPEDVDSLYITDLNLREALLPLIERIRRHAAVTLIDHHPMSDALKAKLAELGVEVTHDICDCASILVYNKYRDLLDHEAARIAVYASIADMFEDGPIASTLLDHVDRKFAEHEALILSHALGADKSETFKKRVLASLAAGAYPHQIEGANRAAQSQLERIVEVSRTVPEKVKRLGRLAYMECEGDTSTGEVANIIMDALGVDVGMCFKVDGEWVNVSFRGERRLPEHLGTISSKLSEKHGGFGGGHNRAAGSKIPRDQLEGYLGDLGKIFNS